MQNKNILSVEDDKNLSMVLKHCLEDEGATLEQVTTGQACLQLLQDCSRPFDLIIMDLGLPDIDGLTLITKIKSIYTGPIIVLSGKASTTDRIVGLEMGANDYITKPFEMRELIARMKVQIRNTQITKEPDTIIDSANDQQNKIYYFADLKYNSQKMALTQGDNIIDLTSGECEMLMILLNSHGRVLTREYLFQQTRGSNYDAYDRSIDIQITRMRKKMGDSAENPQIIKTIRGTGYMFVANVHAENINNTIAIS